MRHECGRTPVLRADARLSESKARQGQTAATLETFWTALRKSRPATLTHRHATAVAGGLYRGWVEDRADGTIAIVRTSQGRLRARSTPAGEAAGQVSFRPSCRPPVAVGGLSARPSGAEVRLGTPATTCGARRTTTQRDSLQRCVPARRGRAQIRVERASERGAEPVITRDHAAALRSCLAAKARASLAGRGRLNR